MLNLTYIHNWPLQHFSQNYGLASNTTHVVWVNFIHKWRNLQLKVDSEWQNFEKLFMAISLTLRDFARNLLRGCRRRIVFLLISDAALRLKTQYTTYWTMATACIQHLVEYLLTYLVFSSYSVPIFKMIA